MGLDMYLKGERFLSEYGREGNKEKKKAVRELFPEIKDTGNLNSVEVSFEIGYWRKANAIHKWFVDNCGEGNDDCRPVYVSRKNMEDLLALCKDVINKVVLEDGKLHAGTRSTPEKGIEEIYEDGKVIVNTEVAKELLPTSSGFFFGVLDYDEWYMNDIKHTIEVLEYALSLPEDYDFYYNASW